MDFLIIGYATKREEKNQFHVFILIGQKYSSSSPCPMTTVKIGIFKPLRRADESGPQDRLKKK
jgi:hypothetical protein